MECIKVVIFLGLVLSIDALRVIGGKYPLVDSERVRAESFLLNSLEELANDGLNYKLIKVISVTKQILAGTKYEYEVELDDGTSPKTCTVIILSKFRLPKNTNKLTLGCPGYEITKTLKRDN